MSQKRLLQILIGVLVITILGTGAVLIPYLISQRQQAGQSVVPTDPDQGRAWATAQSAEAVCVGGNPAKIQVSFTNTEPNLPQWWMDVTVKDLQTDKTVDLGTVKPGETKTGTINTERNSISSGQVRFFLVWSDGRSGTDTRTANYSAVTCQTPPTATPTIPVYSPTPTPTTRPSNTPTPQPSSTPIPTATPTTKPSNTPTPQPSSTPTPRPSSVPSPTPTETPSSCRLTVRPKTVTTTPSPTPTVPTSTPTPPYMCNAPCDTDDQCRQAHRDYICYSATRTCRHVNAPQQDNCNVPTPGPSLTPTPPTGSTATPTPLIVAEQSNLPQVGNSLPTVVLATVGFFIIAAAFILIL